MVVTASATAGVGAGIAAWPFIDSLNPAADALALATTEVDVSDLEPGGEKKAMWRGKPVFIRRRTAAEIEEAKSVALSELPDPQSDEERTLKDKEEWMVVIGVCTHLGCIPLNKDDPANKGEYGGWFCPCHGSHYDISGRIRKGPAPQNLAVPHFEFVKEGVIRIGKEVA